MLIRKRTLTAVIALALSTSMSCGDKNPTQATTPTAAPGASVAPGADGGVSESAGPISAMRFNLVDACADRKGIQARIYDRNNSGVFFPVTGGAFILQSGRNASKVIHCRTGHKMCPGATTAPVSKLFWGVGINGNKTCNRCCRICSTKQVTLEFACTNGRNPVINITGFDGEEGFGEAGFDSEEGGFEE